MFLIENYTVRPAAEAEADVDLKERSVENSLAVEVVTKINKDSGHLRGEEPEVNPEELPPLLFKERRKQRAQQGSGGEGRESECLTATRRAGTEYETLVLKYCP